MNLRSERGDRIINYASLFKRNSSLTNSKFNEIRQTLKKTIQKVKHHIRSTGAIRAQKVPKNILKPNLPKENKEKKIFLKKKPIEKRHKKERPVKTEARLQLESIKPLSVTAVEKVDKSEEKPSKAALPTEKLAKAQEPQKTDVILVAPPGHSLMSISKEILYRVLNSPVK